MRMGNSQVDLDDLLEAWADPHIAAQLAGLHYVSDTEAGLTRKPWGRGFTYIDVDGEHITSAEERARLEALVIPPAWTDVWICPHPDGHLLATGRDEKGRKQYIYHPEWQRVRNEAKFHRLMPFGEALSQIRARCESDLRRRKLCREKVLALVVTLLDQTLIRIGNAAYAQENSSYGLTTLRDRHVDFTSDGCVFEFVGKSGKSHCVTFDDPRLARIVRACRDVVGYDLFQYYDDDGNRGVATSTDVNSYLKETTGQDFTAKDFRTWGGTVTAATCLTEMPYPETKKEVEQQVIEMVKTVSERLGNTTAVCRAYYIHPAIIEGYEEGSLKREWPRLMRRKTRAQLRPEETAVLYYLQEGLKENTGG